MFQWLSSLFGGKNKKGPSSSAPGIKSPGLAPPKPLNREDVDKRFDKGNRIGQGSMSKVFKALDRKLGRNVCLKLLDAKKTEHFESRFKGLNKPPEGEICHKPGTIILSRPWISVFTAKPANPSSSWNSSTGLA